MCAEGVIKGHCGLYAEINIRRMRRLNIEVIQDNARGNITKETQKIPSSRDWVLAVFVFDLRGARPHTCKRAHAQLHTVAQGHKLISPGAVLVQESQGGGYLWCRGAHRLTHWGGGN